MKNRAIDGNTQADQVRDARVFAADPHATQAPKLNPEATAAHRETRKQEVQRSANIVPLAKTTVMNPALQPCNAKMNRNRDTEGIQRLRRLVNHFVVHRAAKERMRMQTPRERRARAT